jgi:putative membrane protein
MKKKPMFAIGIAAVFAVAAGAAQAQTSQPTNPSQQMTPSQTPSESATPSRPTTQMTPSQTQTPSQSEGSNATASPQANKTPSKANEKFMTEAMQGNLAEIKIGELAQEKGQSQGVKQFGQTLVNDHSANQKKAEQVAQSLGVTPPTEPSAKQQAVYDKLSKLSGADFDKQFAQAMVRDHREDIAEFLRESRRSGESASFAKETLPTLRKHLQTARGLTQQKTTTGSRR